ncbi:hypothetical protein IFM89_018000 [Coptis chinensis]|uniref:Target of Myb protein 1 n=1 Tax=Coptis chinensis TaxID=261450 RepID=A0A835HWG5_9MAGN|nr:hypothetical protein IFM89_018000 [Coptis chinensis]
MGRMVSGKMKDLLQAQTTESKMVEEATSDNLQEPNWGMNLRICGMLNSDEFSGQEVLKAIKKKICGKNVTSQRLSLDLLETCAMNCEKVFSEIASEKVLDEMVKMIDDSKTIHGNRLRALQLIRAWGESEDLGYLPVFRQTHNSLKARGAAVAVQDENSAFLGSNFGERSLLPPENYPISDTDLHNIDDETIIFNSGSLSLEEKKEFLVTTRNSVELLSSILGAAEPMPIEDDLTLSILDKCKESQPFIQRIIESTNNDEAMLFEALNLNDELRQVISKYGEVQDAVRAKGKSPESSESADNITPLQVEAGKEVKSNAAKGENTENNNDKSIAIGR